MPKKKDRIDKLLDKERNRYAKERVIKWPKWLDEWYDYLKKK